MTNRTCAGCGIPKPRCAFRVPRKAGPTPFCCLSCVASVPGILKTKDRERQTAAAKAKRHADPEKHRAERRLQNLCNPESARKAVARSTAKFKLEHPEEYAAKIGEKAMRREAAQIQRTPIWSVPEECRAAYRLRVSLQKTTGIRHAVDHSVPLRGKLVSGLHVPENLVVIPYEQNASKGNRFDPMTYEWWPSCCPKPLQK